MSTQQEGRRLRIAFLTILHPFDKRSNSGRLYYMGWALQRHCGDIIYLGPLGFPVPSLLSKIKARISFILFKKRYIHSLSLASSKKWGRIVAQKLAGQAFDAIIVTGGGADIAYVETSIPIVIVGDSTLIQLVDYYTYYTHLSKCSIREIHTIEQRVYKKVRAVIMSCEWAARSVTQDYQSDPEHVYIVPFGANFDTPPPREIIAARELSETCRLLFIGVEWERKGGDIAFETLLKLHEMGIDTELIVCGCVPPNGMTHPSMKVIPFLDKNDELRAREIEKLYTMSHFLILPTRADCTPAVFREACAFGLPIITTNTGGVADIVRDGKNGYVLSLEARGKVYAQVIADLYQDEQRYRQLTQSTRATFEERLNWDVWGHCVYDILVKECGSIAPTITAHAETR